MHRLMRTTLVGLAAAAAVAADELEAKRADWWARAQVYVALC